MSDIVWANKTLVATAAVTTAAAQTPVATAANTSRRANAHEGEAGEARGAQKGGRRRRAGEEHEGEAGEARGEQKGGRQEGERAAEGEAYRTSGTVEEQPHLQRVHQTVRPHHGRAGYRELTACRAVRPAEPGRERSERPNREQDADEPQDPLEMSRVASEATDRPSLSHASDASDRPNREQDVDQPQDRWQ